MAVSNALGILIGFLLIIVGFVLLVIWWCMFITVLKGILPILLILIGAGALVYFISEIKSNKGLEEENKAEVK
jgi:hypothetical protein